MSANVQQLIIEHFIFLFTMTYNPYPKHLALLETRLRNKQALEPLSEYQRGSRMRRESFSGRNTIPYFNPEDQPLKDKLLNQQLKSMETAMSIGMADLETKIHSNAGEQNRIAQISEMGRFESAQRWERQNRASYERSRNSIDMTRSLIRHTPSRLQQSSLGSYTFQYDLIRAKQKEQLRRVELLESEYEKQQGLSRFTLNQYY